MIKYPLFGQDSSPAYTSKILSLIVTAFASLIFLILVLVIKFPPKAPLQKYKTVKISLAREESEIPEPEPELKEIIKEEAPVVEEIGENTSDFIESLSDGGSSPAATEAAAPAANAIPESAPAPAPVPVVEQTVPAKVETPKPVENVKPAEVKKPVEPVKPVETPKPVVKEEVKPVTKTETKSEVIKPEVPAVTKTETKVEDTKQKQVVKDFEETVVDVPVTTPPVPAKKKKEDFDWSIFDNDVPLTSSSTSAEPKKVTTQSTISGSAGTAASDQTSKASSVNSSQNGNGQSASADTNNALSGIVNATASNGTGLGKTGSGSGEGEGDGRFNWKGGSRKLEKPLDPSFNFSDAAQRSLEAYKNIIITFTVGADGLVQPNTLETKPSIPSNAFNEIEREIAGWRFTKGASEATAIFPFVIKKN